MNKKGDFDFEWLPGFREMMACQNEEQNTQQETDLGNENLQIEALLPPEQLQQEEQRYWKDYEYFIQMLPMVAREVWIVGDALLDCRSLSPGCHHSISHIDTGNITLEY